MPELKRRSFVKGISWRIFATTDTILLALIFTGSIGAALSIGALELLTKTLWYYAHERAWLHINTPGGHPLFANLFGQNGHLRSVAKAISWRAIGALDTFLLALIVTGRLAASGSIGGTELITKIALYYLHERLWLHIRWGTVPPAPKENLSPWHETLELLRGYYHAGAAIFYGVLCVLFIIVAASTIYALHATL